MSAPMRLLPGGLNRKGKAVTKKQPSASQIEEEVGRAFTDLVAVAKSSDAVFTLLETELWTGLLHLGRLLVLLFLVSRQQRQQAEQPPEVVLEGRRYRRDKAPHARSLNTRFGVVQYFRTYLRAEGGKGHYPLDAALGLTADRMSFGLLSLGARLATMMSFAKAQGLLCWFLGQAPSTEVLEHTVLGLGRHTGAWFAQAQAPQQEEDGEVLVIQVDGKAAPTATEQELARRRGKRRGRPKAVSPRHRGRQAREQRGSKPRRKKGDKSKNGRLAMVVVLYTLRRKRHQGEWVLAGPINRWTYASFAPKRHVFAIARREADKRGFATGCGKLVQLLSDGDEDLACYAKEYFPEAIHTVDVMHVIEYLYKAGECLHREGSPALADWIADKKSLLYGGQEALLVQQLKQSLAALPKTGPGSKGKRTRLQAAINYLDKRLSQMNYQWLREQDLELGTGIVEGTVKNLVGARFDFGGSRWIRERAESLLQLRCIERNGQWDAFIQWVHDENLRELRRGTRVRVQQCRPNPLPAVEKAA